VGETGERRDKKLPVLGERTPVTVTVRICLMWRLSSVEFLEMFSKQRLRL
jgi:hypothetical protein